ncbi:hypothetical protein QBC39DRAFT_339762 [Podospora conica]|nr:hypothetical protein QBC39DRAFT_339762 [Schizothecium conicum]
MEMVGMDEGWRRDGWMDAARSCLKKKMKQKKKKKRARVLLLSSSSSSSSLCCWVLATDLSVIRYYYRYLPTTLWFICYVCCTSRALVSFPSCLFCSGWCGGSRL